MIFGIFTRHAPLSRRENGKKKKQRGRQADSNLGEDFPMRSWWRRRDEEK